MPFNTTDAAPRADISTFLMEAVEVEKYFVGQRILPIYTSDLQTGRYPKFTKDTGGLLNRESTKRNATGTYNEIERKFEWDTYNCEEYGLEERVDDVVAAQMKNYFDAEMITSKLLMRSVMLDYEVAVASKIMDSGTFTATNGSLAYTEANIATIDFAADLTALIERLTLAGETPNTIIMSLSVFNRLRRSKLLQTYLYGFLNTTQGSANITAKSFADAFGVEEVIITRQSYNLAAKNKPASLGPVWGNDFIFVGNIQSGDFSNGGLGRTIVWGADSPGGLFTSENYRSEPRRGDVIRVRTHRDLKIVNPNAGQLIATRWA